MCQLCATNATTGEERPDISNAPETPVTSAFLESYTVLLYSGAITEYDLSVELYNSVGNYLNKGIDSGFNFNPNKIGIDDDLYKSLRHNIWHFAAAKQYTQNREILRSFVAPLEEVPFPEFKKTARGILDNYNENFLKTEYVTSVANAQSARDWENTIQDETIQKLKYRTQQDANVRVGHRKINGAVYAKDDPFWDHYYPPNGWHCRCFVLDLGSSAHKKTPDQIPVFGKDPDFPKMFKMNAGKQKLIFPNAIHISGSLMEIVALENLITGCR